MNRKMLLLAGLVAAAVPAAQAGTERPRPENFATYSLYIQALVDYQRNQDPAPSPQAVAGAADSKLCRDSDGDEKKKNSCEGKYLLGQNHLPEEGSSAPKSEEKAPAPVYENLEETIARAGYERPLPGPEGEAPARSRFSDFPLAEIPSQDLSETGVEGLLGLFDNVRLRLLTGGGAGGGAGGGSSGGVSLGEDGTLRATLDDYLIALDAFTASLGGLITLRDGYALVDSSVAADGNGLRLTLSAQVRTGLYVVDRDGLPDSGYAAAGAVGLDSLGITVPRLDINLQAIRSTTGDGVFQLDTASPQAIVVALANTRVGAADALADGSRIGPTTDFLAFGPQSRLVIAPGTRVNALVGQPNGLRSPFLTLNGRVGDITVNDISLLDNNSGGAINIGTLALRNIVLADTRVYMDDNRLIVDAGRGLGNLGVEIERLYLGNPGSGGFVGDFYARSGRLVSLQFTAQPH